ncbi:CHASE2 domain-containing serine/threonine-protein kinase [Desulfatitalea alkaliphila]|uniref:non-specific serine/threonine protein kinase n=1 Tax=Desulfatitalea alkaliphila TaxID=2929485 RepID=A0AA41R040_9BACT|nr:serine/threonine-protein kinase [Desulfatitalea alkaliphila]MCJ8499533.1 serine/threonine-protein kinase [Desulfatitalea alkaliphila]
MLKKILAAPSVQIALLSALILMGMLFSLTPWEHLENRYYDFWGHHFRSPQEQPIVIVAIDEKSIRELGDWPWPRSRIAEMVRFLTSQQAGAMGILPLYTQPDANPGLLAIEETQKLLGDREWKGDKQAARTFQGMLSKVEEQLDQDAQLIETVRRGRNVVLPIRFTKGPEAATERNKMSGMLALCSLDAAALAAGTAETPSAEAQTTHTFRHKPITMTGVWEPFEALATKASGLGHLNLDEDRDGLFRSMPLLMEYKDRLFPAMPLQLAIRQTGGDLQDLTVGRNFFGQPCLRIKYLEIATDDQYRLLMNYDAAWTKARTYSFVDVLQGSLDPAIFRDNIILIGATGEEMTPFYRIGPHASAALVEISANVLGRILSTARLSRPAWAQPLEIAALLYFAFFLMFAIPRMETRVGASILGIFLFTWFVIGVALLLGYGYRIKPFGPAALACGGFVLITAAGYARKWRHEVIDANKHLGLHYQGQGLLDMAYERFMKCPLQDGSVKLLLYNLGLDFERKRMFGKALTIYHHIGRYGPFKDIEQRSSRLESPDGTLPAPVNGGNGKPPLLLLDGDIKPTFGRYEILRELGRGSMGTIYLGRDPKINREVAIKTLKYAEVVSGDLDQVKARFFREAEAAGKLSHPNIVSIYDVGEEHDMAYIAMELLNGGNLTRFCAAEHLLPVHQALSIVADVAVALDYAHNQGVIHRDIKPANIMLLEDGRVKVTDFGIALVVDASRTGTGILLGTPNYMSPEQVAGQTLDGRSDLFSLGIVLYELLVGAKPFRGDTINQIIYAIMHEAHPPVSDSEKNIPPCCQAIIEKLLAKGLDERFDAAARLAEAIAACMNELPHAAPATVSEIDAKVDPAADPRGD